MKNNSLVQNKVQTRGVVHEDKRFDHTGQGDTLI